MHYLKALISILLLLLSANVFGFACAGSADFSSIETPNTDTPALNPFFYKLKNGLVLEIEDNYLVEYAESAPIALRLESESKGKIYYALASRDEFYSSYPTNVFTWVDGKGASILDGAKTSFSSADCSSWETKIDALMLDLSGFNNDFSLFTAASVPQNTYFTLLCAPADITLSIQYFDGTEKAYSLGKGIFNEGEQAMVPIGFYSRYSDPEFPGENFASSVIEMIPEEKACIIDSGRKQLVYWNLAGMLESITDSTIEPEPVEPEPVKPEPVEPTEQVEQGEEIPPIETPEINPNEPSAPGPEPQDKPIDTSSGEETDSDNDRFPDATDRCPNVRGVSPDGCPREPSPSSSTAPTQTASNRTTINFVAVSANWRGSDSAFETEMQRHVDDFVERAGLDSCKANFKLNVIPPSQSTGCTGLTQISCLNPRSFTSAAINCVSQHLYTGAVPLNSPNTIVMVGTNQDLEIEDLSRSSCNLTSGQCDKVCTIGVAGLCATVKNPYLIAFETEFTQVSSHEIGHVAGFCEQYSMYEWTRQNASSFISGGCANRYPGKFETNAQHLPTKFWYDSTYEKCSSAEKPSCPQIFHRTTVPAGFTKNNPGPYNVCSALPYSSQSVAGCPSNDGIVFALMDCLGREIVDSTGRTKGYGVMGPAHGSFISIAQDLIQAGKGSERYFDCYEKTRLQNLWGCGS